MKMADGSIVSSQVRASMRARVEPLAQGLGRLGLTPNALTLIGFGIAIVAAYTAASQQWLYAGLLVISGGAFDLFDGALARATNRTTKLGAFLDSMFDRWGEAVVYVGILVGLADAGYGDGPTVAAAAMASAFMVSYVRAKSESLGFTPGSDMASVGLAPREVRIVILTVGLIGAGLTSNRVPDYPAGLAGGAVIPLWWMVLVGSLALITLLATITTIQRIVHVYREASKQEPQ